MGKLTKTLKSWCFKRMSILRGGITCMECPIFLCSWTTSQVGFIKLWHQLTLGGDLINDLLRMVIWSMRLIKRTDWSKNRGNWGKKKRQRMLITSQLILRSIKILWTTRLIMFTIRSTLNWIVNLRIGQGSLICSAMKMIWKKQIIRWTKLIRLVPLESKLSDLG